MSITFAKKDNYVADFVGLDARILRVSRSWQRAFYFKEVW